MDKKKATDRDVINNMLRLRGFFLNFLIDCFSAYKLADNEVYIYENEVEVLMYSERIFVVGMVISLALSANGVEFAKTIAILTTIIVLVVCYLIFARRKGWLW